MCRNNQIKSNTKGSVLKQERGSSAHSIFTKFLRFMGVRQSKVVSFSKDDVGVAFACDTNIKLGK